MELMVLTIISCLILVGFFLRLKNRDVKLHDSLLKQRKILNANEQLLLKRLLQHFPYYTTLSKVSYDALLTTKFGHTRHKFSHLTADFVVLNKNYDVVVIIALYDPVLGASQQLKTGQYQCQLLTMAGYKTLSYIGVPDEACLKQDIQPEPSVMVFA